MFEILSLPSELQNTLRLCEKVAIELTAFLKDQAWLNGDKRLEIQVNIAARQLIQVRDAIRSCIAKIKNIRSATRKLARDRVLAIMNELRDASALCVDATDNLRTCLLQYTREMTGKTVLSYVQHKNKLLLATQGFRDLSIAVTKCRHMAVEAWVTLTLKKAPPSHTDPDLMQLLARLDSVDCKEGW